MKQKNFTGKELISPGKIGLSPSGNQPLLRPIQTYYMYISNPYWWFNIGIVLIKITIVIVDIIDVIFTKNYNNYDYNIPYIHISISRTSWIVFKPDSSE